MKKKVLSTENPSMAPHAPPGPEFWGEVLRTCGSFNLRKASRVVTQFYDDMLRPTGLRSTQVVLLAALAAEGDMSVGRMARVMVMSPSTLSRTLTLLERDGLVESTLYGKRGKLLHLTAAGEKALLSAVPYWQKAQEQFTAQLGASAWVELNERLARTVTVTRG
jgi:DNA-binding MarR family transcriptional regulator